MPVQKQGSFVPENISALLSHFGCTGDLYRISAGKFIPDRKKKSISFSFSPSTSDDLYILDLKSGPWTDFGCCYFISLSLSLSSSNFLFLSLFTVAAGTAEIYRIGTYTGTETSSFILKNIPALPGSFNCTGDLYRISAGKFIPDWKKKSISFSLSPSTSDDLYILDLKSGPWTNFGCCYFIFIFFSPLSLCVHLTFSFSLSLP